LRSANPLERVTREIGRRTAVVGKFLNDAALLRLAGRLLIEQNDEWLVSRRYLSKAWRRAHLHPTNLDDRKGAPGHVRPPRAAGL
jgi:transposase-like protein